MVLHDANKGVVARPPVKTLVARRPSPLFSLGQIADDSCETPPPFGFGMTAEELEALIASKPLAQQLAADPDLPILPEHGEIGNGRRGNNVTSTPRGNSASYWVRRLKRDRPDIADALARG